jgi:hypothetical protein
MSSRMTRTLLRLYPRRIRDRYGQELLDLEDELRAQGEVSHARLTWDVLTGALMLRYSRRRTRVVTAVVLAGAVCVVVGLVVAAGGIGGPGNTGSPARESRQRAQLLAHVAYPGGRGLLPYGTACPIGAGSSCSLTPCTEFVAQSSDEDVVAHNSTPTIERVGRVRATRCPTHQPGMHRAVLSAQAVTTPRPRAAAATAQPATQ